MRTLTFMAWLALLPGTMSLGGADLDIQKHNRVPNDAHHPVCWWACAEMLGKEYGITPLFEIRQQVLRTGVGRDEGATAQAIAYWMKKLDLKLRAHQSRDLGWLHQQLQQGLPVIVSLKQWWSDDPKHRNNTHAVILTRIGDEKEHFIDANLNEYNERLVSFIDPNQHQRIMQHTLDWFLRNWSGRAYVFDPREQKAELVLKPKYSVPASPTPLVQAQPLAVVPVLTPDLHQLHIPSNQDIQDGVRRPNDTLVGFASYQSAFRNDYYREFKKGK